MAQLKNAFGEEAKIAATIRENPRTVDELSRSAEGLDHLVSHFKIAFRSRIHRA